MRGRLRELRDSKFLSQEDMSQAIGVSLTMWGSWERGVYQPSLEMIYRICLTFNANPSYLLGF